MPITDYIKLEKALGDLEAVLMQQFVLVEAEEPPKPESPPKPKKPRKKSAKQLSLELNEVQNADHAAQE